ncbi:MAG: hypothetical protein KGH58_04615 [Candidatus Micrarchaeota archaeon]|nr:hypothetical protein [Candidatus Micrarchaeota archaeon]
MAYVYDKLAEKYPFMQRQRQPDPRFISNLYWAFGIECGPGWYELIDELCGYIQKHLESTPGLRFEPAQIKEKFGGLRFYYDYGDDYIRQLVNGAEEKSFKVCEGCGKSGRLMKSKTGWLRTLCSMCQKLSSEGFEAIQ